MRIVVAVGLVLLLLAQPALSQVPDDKLIVPGQRIGKWSIGATAEDLAAMNGSGSDAAAFGEDVQPGWREFSWPSLGLRAGHRRGSNRIEYLDLYSSTRVATGFLWSFRTAEGVGHNFYLSAVVGNYGTPTIRTKPGTIEAPPIPYLPGSSTRTMSLSRLIYDEKGIAFTMLEMQLVVGIVVFPPGTAKTIWRF